MAEQKGKSEKRFYPDYLSEIVATIFICFEILVILALLSPPAIGRQIDFLKPFQPRPEWYFLWLFELVGYFPGETAIIGTVLVPVIYVVLLLFIPAIDKGKNGRLKATLVGISLLLMFVIFTLLSII
jgi:quinol-cytochrome oxidoreductase complex cytochrome b subunit